MGTERAALKSTVASTVPDPTLAAGKNSTICVLDTNIVLDIWLFSDARSAWLLPRLTSGAHHWLATAAMREELARVLGYPRLVRQLDVRKVEAQALLAAFDQHARIVDEAAAAPSALKCIDPDDQKFIDLAWAHSAALISRDAAVLTVLGRWQKLAPKDPHLTQNLS